MAEIAKCKKCGGKGQIRTGTCMVCQGSGRVFIGVDKDGRKVITPAVKKEK